MDTYRALGEASTCSAPLSFAGASAVIIVFCVLGLIWALINYRLVKKIDVGLGVGGEHGAIVDLSSDQKELLVELGEKISEVVVPLFREPTSS